MMTKILILHPSSRYRPDMELLLTSDLASDLTKQVHTAMEIQDLEACRDLLQRRERAME